MVNGNANGKEDMYLSGVQLGDTNSFKYLGATLSEDGSLTAGIRISIVTVKCWMGGKHVHSTWGTLSVFLSVCLSSSRRTLLSLSSLSDRFSTSELFGSLLVNVLFRIGLSQINKQTVLIACHQ